MTRVRTTTALMAAAGLLVAILPAAGGAAAAEGDAPAMTSAPESAAAQAAAPAKKKHKKLKQKVFLATSASAVQIGTKVEMTVRLHPETTRTVTIQYKRVPLSGGKWKSKSWKKARKVTTDGHGHRRISWKAPKKGKYRLRVLAPATKRFTKSTSEISRLRVNPIPTVYTLTATFPATGYVDVPVSVPVTITPTASVTVQVQSWSSATNSWADVAGASGPTTNGQATLTFQQGIAGPEQYRVLASNGAATAQSTIVFDANYLDAFYTPPADAPSTPGVLLRTMPMTGTPPDNKIPTATLPTGVTQYRYLYSTMRYDPVTANSSPDVTSGMVYLPPPGAPTPPGYSATNRPVVVWAHPTLGLAQPCAPSAGAIGYTSNYLDMSWFLSAGGEFLDIKISGGGSVSILPRPGGLLANGYVVVMPDYLSVATPGKETYVIGQQEANDVLYAAKAMQTPASSTLGWNFPPVPASTWPGTGAGGDIIVTGHSQGGHAAMWVGANEPLANSLGLNIKGIVPIAPASDLLTTFNYSWNTQMGWVLGPYAAKTFVDYFGTSFLSSLTPAAQANYAAMASMCLPQIESYVETNYPSTNGVIGGPVTTTFSIQPDPNNVAFAVTWGAQLNQMTPILATQQVAPLVPLPTKPGYAQDIPTLLVQGQGDYVILGQTTAALAETMCRANYPLDTYWPAANPEAGQSFQGITLPGVADHGTILNWPIPDSFFSLLPNAPPAIDQETPASRVAEWIDARFKQVPQAKNCDAPWTFTAPNYPLTYSGFTIDIPASTDGIHQMLPQPACTTTNPNEDGDIVPMQCWPPNNSGEYPGIANDFFSILWQIPTASPSTPPWGDQETPLLPNTQNAGTPAFPPVSFGGMSIDAPGAGLYTIGNRVGVYPYGADLSTSGSTWSYVKNTKVFNGTGPSGESLPNGYLYAKAGDPTPGKNSYMWGYYPASGVYYRTPGMPPVVIVTGMTEELAGAITP